MFFIYRLLLSALFLLTVRPLQAQSCDPVSLSSAQLLRIPAGVNKCTFLVTHQKKTISFTIAKAGDGEALYPIKKTVGSSEEGIWIGKSTIWSDYSDITLSFSEPMVSLSFLLSAINNDAAGTEEIQNIQVWHDLQNLTAQSHLKWLTGAASGMPGSDPLGTVFDEKSRTITAKPSFCCDATGGRLSVSSSMPFNKITFKCEKTDLLLSKANGIILSGPMNFCLLKPEQVVEQEKQTEKKSMPKKEPAAKNKSTVSAHTQQPKEQRIVLKHISFEQGKAVLLNTSFEELDYLSALMNTRPTMTIELHGHTDNQGLEELNQKLSEQRVEAVKNYLVAKGIDAKRITGKGFGGSQPLVPNDSEEQRKQNRRVEVVVMSN